MGYPHQRGEGSYWTGARVEGHVSISTGSNSILMEFSSRTDNIYGSELLSPRLLPQREEDAPFWQVFFDAQMPHKLIYLLSLGRGSAWTATATGPINPGSYNQARVEKLIRSGHWKVLAITPQEYRALQLDKEGKAGK